MKKVICVLLVLVMMLGLVGCGKSDDVVALEELIDSIGEVTLESEGKIIEARAMYIELDDKQKEKVENYSVLEEAENTLQVLIEEARTSWEIQYFVDEFGDPTDSAYMVGTFEGSFSNSATSNSELLVYLYYYSSENDFAFRLGEYGDSLANYYSDDLMTIHMKLDGETYAVELFGTAPTGDLYFYDTISDRGLLEESVVLFTDEREMVSEKFINALRAGETIPCYIIIGTETDHMNQVLAGTGGSKYSFEIEGKGFADVEASLAY